jgi:hypothetical protein
MRPRLALCRVEDTSGNKVVELRHGDALGMWALMGDHDASSPFGYPVNFVAESHLKVLPAHCDVFHAQPVSVSAVLRCDAGL